MEHAAGPESPLREVKMKKTATLITAFIMHTVLAAPAALAAEGLPFTSPAAPFPETGGIGWTVPYIVGFGLLAGLAAAYIVRRRLAKKKKNETETGAE